MAPGGTSQFALFFHCPAPAPGYGYHCKCPGIENVKIVAATPGEGGTVAAHEVTMPSCRFQGSIWERVLAV